MKILELSDSISIAKPIYMKTRMAREYLAYELGNEPNKEVYFPLKAADFPQQKMREIDWHSENFILKTITQNTDSIIYVLERGEKDANFLVLVKTPPARQGQVKFVASGACQTIARARVIEGIRGALGYGENGAVLVWGPCRIEVHRTGKLSKIDPAQICAEFDGEKWRLTSDVENSINEYIF